MNSTDWDPETLQQISEEFAARSPRALLQWGVETFFPDMALGTGFGPSGIVLLHMVAQLRPTPTVFYLDTDLLFPETYALRDELEERLGLPFKRVHGGLSLSEQATKHGAALWARDPDRCCNLRKVRPLQQFLASQRAWITGLRRDQAPSRRTINLVEWSRTHGLVKLNPLADWSEEDIWSYLRAYDLPYNPLHDRGYPSIGCMPCTQAIAPGEDTRAGRWRGQEKTECGIHLQAQPCSC